MSDGNLGSETWENSVHEFATAIRVPPADRRAWRACAHRTVYSQLRNASALHCAQNAKRVQREIKTRQNFKAESVGSLKKKILLISFARDTWDYFPSLE